MKKNSHLVIQIKDGEGRLCAYPLTIPNSNNLVSVLEAIKDIYTANICDTKKESEDLARYWNECARRNGNYMFARLEQNDGGAQK